MQLFEEVLVEDPLMVRDICMRALNSVDEEKKHGTAKQIFILETFSKMIELITLRHRIIETSLETALLSRSAMLRQLGLFLGRSKLSTRWQGCQSFFVFLSKAHNQL